MSIIGNPILMSGGGGGAAVATVAVHYASGHMVTATDGTMTLTSDTSGDYTFYIPNYGTWTFTDTTTQDSISVVVNAMLVDLNFRLDLSAYGQNSATVSNNQLAGNYTILVLAINGEASTYALDIATTLNNTALTGTTISYQESDDSSTASTRNHRFNTYDATLTGDDTINVTVTNSGRYVEAILMVFPYLGVLALSKVRTSNGARIQDSFGSSCYVVYGFANGRNNTVTVNADIYIADATVDTGSGQVSYGAGYIFWLGVQNQQ